MIKAIKKIAYKYIGKVTPQESSDLQNSYIKKIHQGKNVHDVYVLAFCHDKMISCGTHSDVARHILVGEQSLQDKGVDLVHEDHGGQVYYMDPGVLVFCIIADLRIFGFGIKSYIKFLEEITIDFLLRKGVKTHAEKGRIWVGAKQIGGIGLHIIEHVAKHGIVLNVDCELKNFSLINTCGYEGTSSTSIKVETGAAISLKECADIMATIVSEKAPGTIRE